MQSTAIASRLEAIEAIERLSAHEPDPGARDFFRRALRACRRELRALRRFVRRAAEVRDRIARALSFDGARRRALAQLDELEAISVWLVARPRLLFRLLAHLDLAIVVVALRQSAPAGMLVALFYAPLVLLHVAAAHVIPN